MFLKLKSGWKTLRIWRFHSLFEAMSVATRPRSSTKPLTEPRAILGPAGNRVRVSDESKRRTEALKKPQRPKVPVSQSPKSVVQSNVSVDSCCSSDSSSSNSSFKTASSRKTVKQNGVKQAKPKVASTADEVVTEISPAMSGPLKRCDWITPFSGKLVKQKTILNYWFF